MATNWRQLLTVEPVMFFYAYGLFMAMPVFQQYIYHRLSEEHQFPYNFKEQTSSCGSSLNESMEKLEKKVCFNYYNNNVSVWVNAKSVTKINKFDRNSSLFG